MMGGFWPGMMGSGGLGFGLGWLRMIIFWALIIWLIVIIVRKLIGQGGCECGKHKHGADAMNILKERYAKGEINKEEFEEKKKDL